MVLRTCPSGLTPPRCPPCASAPPATSATATGICEHATRSESVCDREMMRASPLSLPPDTTAPTSSRTQHEGQCKRSLLSRSKTAREKTRAGRTARQSRRERRLKRRENWKRRERGRRREERGGKRTWCKACMTAAGTESMLTVSTCGRGGTDVVS
eukprot:1474115-Rhodomonas_salina.1